MKVILEFIMKSKYTYQDLQHFKFSLTYVKSLLRDGYISSCEVKEHVLKTFDSFETCYLSLKSKTSVLSKTDVLDLTSFLETYLPLQEVLDRNNLELTDEEDLFLEELSLGWEDDIENGI